MSAFVPSDKHFQYMANYLVKSGYYHSSKVDSIIQTLVNACFKSVNYSYKSKDKSYKFIFKENKLLNTNAAQFIKLARCVNYQACEPDNWEKTKAYRLLRELVYMACSDVKEINDTEWSI